MVIRKFFPGANSSEGFYSLYHYILPKPQIKIILKGGPGVGKSTFIKKIARELMAEGWEVEHCCCSSDNSSLDGTVIDKRAAVIDGTAPHTVDPIHPGAVDDIIHLGEYWDEEFLWKNREEVIHLGNQISQHFTRAYLFLKEAGIQHLRLQQYYQEGWHKKEEKKLLSLLKEELFSATPHWLKREPQKRHVFASAITPDGVVSHLPSLLSHLEKIYVLEDRIPEAQDRILKSIKEEAINRGFSTLILHCGLFPKKVHHIILEELKTAIITKTPLHKAPAHQKIKKVIPLYHCREGGYGLERELTAAEEDFEKTLQKACQEMKKARNLHLKREDIYIQAMDFQGVNGCTKKTLERIRTSLRAP